MDVGGEALGKWAGTVRESEDGSRAEKQRARVEKIHRAGWDARRNGRPATDAMFTLGLGRDEECGCAATATGVDGRTFSRQISLVRRASRRAPPSRHGNAAAHPRGPPGWDPNRQGCPHCVLLGTRVLLYYYPAVPAVVHCRRRFRSSSPRVITDPPRGAVCRAVAGAWSRRADVGTQYHLRRWGTGRAPLRAERSGCQGAPGGARRAFLAHRPSQPASQARFVQVSFAQQWPLWYAVVLRHH